PNDGRTSSRRCSIGGRALVREPRDLRSTVRCQLGPRELGRKARVLSFGASPAVATVTEVWPLDAARYGVSETQYRPTPPPLLRVVLQPAARCGLATSLSSAASL